VQFFFFWTHIKSMFHVIKYFLIVEIIMKLLRLHLLSVEFYIKENERIEKKFQFELKDYARKNCF